MINYFPYALIKRQWRVLLFAAPLLLFSGVVLIDILVLEIHPLREGIPVFNTIYLIRTLLIIICSGLTILSIQKFNRTYEDHTHTINQIRELPVLLFLIIALSISGITFFLIDARLFSQLCREDNLVENLSAVLFGISAIGFTRIAFLIFRKSNNRISFGSLISLALALIFFLIAMEEISWFQRLLHFETTQSFQKNLQHEMNLHNFATRETENLFYFCSFVFFVVLPNISLRWLFKKNEPIVTLFIPGTISFLSSSVFISYNYDMWNISFIQFAYFLTHFYLLKYCITLRKRKTSIFLPVLALICSILTQAIILLYGHNQIRIWDITEYKELFIACSFFIYYIEVRQRVRKPIELTQ